VRRSAFKTREGGGGGFMRPTSRVVLVYGEIYPSSVKWPELWGPESRVLKQGTICKLPGGTKNEQLSKAIKWWDAGEGRRSYSGGKPL